jgi:hypothetical protein
MFRCFLCCKNKIDIDSNIDIHCGDLTEYNLNDIRRDIIITDRIITNMKISGKIKEKNDELIAIEKLFLILDDIYINETCDNKLIIAKFKQLYLENNIVTMKRLLFKYDRIISDKSMEIFISIIINIENIDL